MYANEDDFEAYAAAFAYVKGIYSFNRRILLISKIDIIFNVYPSNILYEFCPYISCLNQCISVINAFF